MRPHGRNQLPNRARIRTKNLSIEVGSRNIGTVNLSIETGTNRKLESGNRNIETENRRIPITANGNQSLGNGNTTTIRTVSVCISPIAIGTSSENTSATTARTATTAVYRPASKGNCDEMDLCRQDCNGARNRSPMIWSAVWDRCRADIRA